MNGLTCDYIAIDTNVFLHLTNEKFNSDRHIHKLLQVPKEGENKIHLLVDTNGEIFSEYGRHLLKEEFLQSRQRKNEAQIIKYWLRFAPRKPISVHKTDQLWSAIFSIIPEAKEEVDRIFVYVAFQTGRILISNDRKHIVSRRGQLKSCYRNGFCSNGADVMDSQEAYNRIQNTGTSN